MCLLFRLSFLVLILISSIAHSQEKDPPSIIFGLAREPLTIGDLKPNHLALEEKSTPKVSVEFVLKRYRKLFDTAKSPTVRIDALNRINTLTSKYGIESEEISIGQVEQSKAVIDAYDRIVDSGVFYDRMDEFLYQTAKALETTGRSEDSVKRLEYLIGLYPDSPLYDEANFRIAEGYFKMGKYVEAEALYKKLLAFAKTEQFNDKAQFKIGWAQFQQNRLLDAGKSGINMLGYFDSLKGARNLDSLKDEKGDLADDTLRLLALVFSKGDGTNDIELLQSSTGKKDYTFLLYDSLFRFYLRQQSYADAAGTAEVYSENYFSLPDSFAMLVKAIRAYRKAELPIEEWRLKEKFVASYGIKKEYWSKSNAEAQKEIRNYLTTYLEELAHLNFVRMQQAKTKVEKTEHALLSANYYLELTETDDTQKALGRNLYLAAEAFTVSDETTKAIRAYEKSAYEAPDHKDANESGYAAILSYQELPASTQVSAARRNSVELFTQRFVQDDRTPDLLSGLSQEYLTEKDFAKAVAASERVVAHKKATKKSVYSAWLVNAHANFAQENFLASEIAYAKTLEFPKFIETKEDKTALRERLAASIYKQAESQTNPETAASLFLKVVDVVPEASFGAQSVYDASVSYMKAEKWTEAIASMSFFQDAYPKHELGKDISEKLVFAYINNEEPVSAAESLLQIAEASSDRERSMDAIYQASELYRDAGFELEHIGLLERFVSEYAEVFDLNMEALDTLSNYYLAKGFAKEGNEWRQKLISYESKGGSSRTGRSKTIAAKATYDIALLDLSEYEKAKLTLPLKASLKKKKSLLDNLVKKFEAAADYGISEYVTASTFQLGQIYKTLSADLLTSERPPGLNELEMEQYNILLEEQAYPFEEQAIALFEVNTVKAREGNYDEWIQKSFTVLAQMNPTAYQREALETEYAPEYF